MNSISKKTRDLLWILLIYIAAYAIGYALCLFVQGEILRYFVFDIAATIVVFIFSHALHNSSVYDAYWSLTPMLMSIVLFITEGAFSFWQILFLIVFNLWSVRLTLNWVIVTTGFSYEDWRYQKYREDNTPAMWFFLNFTGIHMVPTLVVFAGMLPLFEIARQPMNAWCLPGIAVMLFGISMEFFADKQMHLFLKENSGKNQRRTVCREGLWKYSRHPNYLGEMSVWTGVYLTMLPFAISKWFYVIGALAVILLFNAVSIPLMEKRQMARRPEYEEYRKETSRVLLLPEREKHA